MHRHQDGKVAGILYSLRLDNPKLGDHGLKKFKQHILN